jgi:hypothetical protein
MTENISRAGVERVAATVLRHVRPETKPEAVRIIRIRLGCYGIDEATIAQVVESHFGEHCEPRELEKVA